MARFPFLPSLLYLSLHLIECMVSAELYKGYQLLELETTEEKTELIRVLRESLDFWSPHLVLVPKDQIQTIRTLFEQEKIRYNVTVPDISVLLENEQERLKFTRKRLNDQATNGPSSIRLDGYNSYSQLLENYGQDEKVTELVDELDWYIVPIVNPDGYEYTWTTDRFWRKNRAPTRNRNCAGVDLNRNFDWRWAEFTASRNPCSPIYAGVFPFSEPETRAISDFLTPMAHRFRAFITLHAFSQIWMYPFGQPNTPVNDERDLVDVAHAAVNQIQSLYGTHFSVRKGVDALYPTSGTSRDWAKGRLNIKYSYLLELRPSEHFRNQFRAFLLPENEIIPSAKETWAGLKVVAENLL